jgi:serine protease
MRRQSQSGRLRARRRSRHQYAVGKGCFVAIAAGNDFTTGNATEVYPEIASRVQAPSPSRPSTGQGHAFYSSTGPWVELAAPGGDFTGAFGDTGGVLQQTLNLDLVTTFDLDGSQFTAPRFDSLAYFYYIGTSQATPHVSGLAAMLMQQGITNPAAIEAALERLRRPAASRPTMRRESVTPGSNPDVRV